MGLAEIAIGIVLILVILVLTLLLNPPSAWVGKDREEK
jgi:hypothetical protein